MCSVNIPSVTSRSNTLFAGGQPQRSVRAAGDPAEHHRPDAIRSQHTEHHAEHHQRPHVHANLAQPTLEHLHNKQHQQPKPNQHRIHTKLKNRRDTPQSSRAPTTDRQRHRSGPHIQKPVPVVTKRYPGAVPKGLGSVVPVE